MPGTWELAGNPVPLGAVAVAAAGTPVSAIANFPTYTDLYANKIDFQCPLTNAGQIFLGVSGMVRATSAGVRKILQPGESWSSTHNVGLNVYHVQDFYVDADNNGDVAIVSAHVA
jgi:hypothetical protein